MSFLKCLLYFKLILLSNRMCSGCILTDEENLPNATCSLHTKSDCLQYMSRNDDGYYPIAVLQNLQIDKIKGVITWNLNSGAHPYDLEGLEGFNIRTDQIIKYRSEAALLSCKWMNVTLPVDEARRNAFRFYYNYTHCRPIYDRIIYTVTPIIRNDMQKSEHLEIICDQLSISAHKSIFSEIIDMSSIQSHSYGLYVPVLYNYLYLYNITSISIRLLTKQYGDAAFNFYRKRVPSCRIELMGFEEEEERFICQFLYLIPGEYTVMFSVKLRKSGSTSSTEYKTVGAQVKDEYYFDYVSDDNITITASHPHGLTITFPVAPPHFNLGGNYSIKIQDSKQVTIRRFEYQTRSMKHNWTYNTVVIDKLTDYVLENVSVTIRPTQLHHCTGCSPPSVTKYYMLPSQDKLDKMIHVVVLSSLLVVVLIIVGVVLFICRKRLNCQKNTTSVYIISDGTDNDAINELKKLLTRFQFSTKHCTALEYEDMCCVERSSNLVLYVRDPDEERSKPINSREPGSLKSSAFFKFISFNIKSYSKSDNYYILPCDLQKMISYLCSVCGKSTEFDDKSLTYIKESKKTIVSILMDLGCDDVELKSSPAHSFTISNESNSSSNLQTDQTYQEQSTNGLLQSTNVLTECETQVHYKTPSRTPTHKICQSGTSGIVFSTIEDNISLVSYNSSMEEQEETTPTDSVRMSFNVENLRSTTSENTSTFFV